MGVQRAHTHEANLAEQSSLTEPRCVAEPITANAAAQNAARSTGFNDENPSDCELLGTPPTFNMDSSHCAPADICRNEDVAAAADSSGTGGSLHAPETSWDGVVTTPRRIRERDSDTL